MLNKRIKNNSGAISELMLIAISIFILAGVGAFASYRFFAPTRTVSVIGTARENAIANRGVVTFAYTANASLQQIAVTNGEEQFGELLTQINNLAPTEVKRIPYQVQQVTAGDGSTQYQYVSGAQVTVGSQQNVLSLTQLLERNGAQIASVRYLPENEETVNSSVRQKALEDARKKAEQIAGASNGSVGKVLTVNEEVSNTQTGSGVTTVSPLDGNNNVEVQTALSVTFELK